MSIGWIMFWKGVALAIWAIVIDHYRAKRADYRKRGLELRPGGNGVYQAHDAFTIFEKRLRFACIAFAIFFIPYTLLVVYLVLTA